MSAIKFLDILNLDHHIREQIRQWRNKADIRTKMLRQHVITSQEHAKWFMGLKQSATQRHWLITCEDIPIGCIYLSEINKSALSAQWGFYIGDDQYKGRGLGKQILVKFLEEFFEHMGFEVLLTKVLSNNTVSLNLYKQMGFQEKEEQPYKDDVKIVLMEFRKSDWLKAKREPKPESCKA